MQPQPFLNSTEWKCSRQQRPHNTANQTASLRIQQKKATEAKLAASGPYLATVVDERTGQKCGAHTSALLLNFVIVSASDFPVLK